MKKLAILNFFTVWFILAAALFLLPDPARAYVYDDFTGPGINESLWVDSIPDPDLFSQPGDGNLYFNDPYPGHQYDGLRSLSRWNTPFFVSMQYADFQGVNNTTGNFQGSGPVLWVGYSTNSVRVYEYIDDGTFKKGFRAIRIVNGDKAALGEIIPTNVNDARLGINYDGAWVSFWYDVGSGWQEIPLWAPYAPGFTNDPFFGMVGYNEFGESMSFRVEQVDFNPVPVPPGVWLLGSGLLGLAGLGRRLKRN